jgi:mannose-6-phosphate isomerase-like protein (cupin superfamily)
MDHGTLSAAHDVLAPDGSEIRLAGRVAGASLVECVLPPGGVSAAVRHRTVEEVWLVVAGEGDVWRSRDGRQTTLPVAAGSWLTIPVGTHFQFRATGRGPLRIVIATAPPWPGPDEAVRVEDHWVIV